MKKYNIIFAYKAEHYILTTNEKGDIIVQDELFNPVLKFYTNATSEEIEKIIISLGFVKSGKAK